MTVKVSDVMRHVRNHFIRDAITGTWSHTGGMLTPAEALAPGMWIAITGPGILLRNFLYASSTLLPLSNLAYLPITHFLCDWNEN